MSPLNHLPLCRSLLWISALVIALLALAPCAQAAVKIEGTRLIYFGQYKEASISIVSQSPGELVVQSWVTRENGDATLPAPFAVVQSLVRLDAQQHQ